MTNWKLLATTWEFHPSVIIGCVLVALVYLWARQFRMDLSAVWFLAGIVVIFLALVSPLDALGDDYLFSAHMLQHILLNMAAPPLFVLGITNDLARKWISRPLISRTERILGHPILAWFLGSGVLWVWHLPALYNATLESESIHILEHLMFIATGTILWWPALNPLDERRLKPLLGVVYLLLASLPNALLGIIFTVASTPFYSGYAHPDDELGALSLIRDTWGLDQIQDQMLGGAFMWVIGSGIYFWGILVLLRRWYRQAEKEAA